MEMRSNIHTSRASNVIQRPPVSRVPRANTRESFPGRLIVPNIPKQLDIPSVNVIPPPALYTYSQDGGTHNYLNHHDDLDGPGRIYSPVHNYAHHSRHLSVSSYATQYTQRTQSTLQAIPTRTLSTTRQHRRGKASFASSTGRGGRTSTPIHFFKRNLRRGSNPGGDNHDKIDADDYQELESQATEPGSGFQYAATPSVDPLNVTGSPSDLQAPLPMPAMRARQPSPVPTSGEKHCISISIVGGIKFLEELAKRLKIFFRAGRRVGEWKVSMRVKGSKAQEPRTEMAGGSDPITDKSRGKMKAPPTPHSRHGQINGGNGSFSWGPGEKTLRIKNNGTGSCVFMITTAPGNPQEIIETPLSLPYLQSQLFVHSKNLIRALEDWNKHFQNPPPHWVINFVPKAYLRRGWHLAEEVAEYLRTYGLNAEVDSSGFHRSAWKVEYEAIGHKACLVDGGGKPYGSEVYRAGQNAGQNLGVVLGNGVRERHPSRCWERKEGWDGCRGLVVGIAL